MKSSANNDSHILVVDNEKDILDLFSEYLVSNRFNIISFQYPFILAIDFNMICQN